VSEEGHSRAKPHKARKRLRLAVQQTALAPAAKTEEEGGQRLRLDLRSYGNEDRLVRNLFESPTFQSWTKGDHTLHVFVDSLDECLLRLDNLAALLVDELRKYPVERLCLRIACRTADWPNTLEEGLRQLWGSDSLAVYELAPLCRTDVIEAAQTAGLDPDLFLTEIDRKEIVALAIKPVTLNFLINVYGRTSEFPSTQAELYHQGCRLLCEETNESRRDARRIAILSANQRMAVAARVAAITVFGARYAIWTGVDRGDVPDVDVTISQLCGGTESTDGVQFEVTEIAVREALGTGLFSSRGPNRLGWAHQTYAAFLAAWYLVQHEMTSAQVMSLIVSPGDPDEKLVPQLHEASAWLAGMIPAVFREIMRTDPQVLLRSDVATADLEDRAGLVEVLLRRFDEEELLDSEWDIRRRYRKLAHLSLAEQLQPCICDQAKGVIVRRVAETL
jgi:predicted NACHT family NTPase